MSIETISSHKYTHTQGSGAVSESLVGAMPHAVESACGSFDRKARRLLRECGIELNDPTEWYDLKQYASALQTLKTESSPMLVERIGRFSPSVMETADPVLTNYDEINDWYQALHQDAHLSVEFTLIEDCRGEVMCDTPYPAEFEAGVIRYVSNQRTDGSVQGVIVDTTTTDDGRSQFTLM